MRIVLVLLVGAALGFGGGWLAFHDSTDAPSQPEALTYEQVQAEFLRQLRRNESQEIDSASCQSRDGTRGSQYVCTVSGPNPYAFMLYDYVVSVRGRTVDYRRRLTTG